ncbi:ubinuclein-1-like isoform X1 [Biomphalaria glabrata]|uniref:Ubinuclein-1-like isoform X1 n=1 Tax=Biomphalaria glabrata TaxID=6526 RepID=A0A9U8E6T5_BIOGL|nr:ubinuclein-1-like isoform X1 [Biomphalaria glabrata]
MLEMKRVELTSVQSPSKQKKVPKKKDTYRFTLSLSESTLTTCPEFSLADLIKNQRVTSEPFDNVDDDDDSDVAAIAQRFEAKYGPKALHAGKKKRTQEMDDYYDLGEGYDEEDTFIDNTEAYDEVVPSTLTTKHGGFYINTGKLDFKSLHEDSVDEVISSPIVKKKKKKRLINSDSEEGDFEETGESLTKKFKAMKRKKLLESKENEKKKRKLTIGPDGEMIVKKKKKKHLEKIQKMDGKVHPEPEAPPLSTPTITCTPVAVVTPTVTEPTTTATSVVTNGGDHDTTAIKDFKTSIEETFNAILTMKEDSSSKSGEEGKGEQQSTEKNTQLPSQLPVELVEAIDNIKKEARENKEGKMKFFSADINKLLLDIELGTRNLPWGSRTAIYKHLSEHLPCGTHALQRRAKKLRELQQEDQLKVPTQKLKEAIMKEMPALEEQHELDVARAKLGAELKDENIEALKEEASTESEEEDKTESNKKKTRGPRRKFQWTSEIKALLLEIVSTKMKLYNTCKTRNQTAEEYLKAYLDADIKPIWPQGWMQTRMLYKESRSAHEDMTKGITSQPKPKKSSCQSSTPSSELSHSVTTDTSRIHVSKTEDVIEITDDRTDTVVVNLSNSDPLTASYGSQPKITDLSQGDTLTPSVRPGKQSAGRSVPSTPPPWVVLQPTNVVNLTQKYNDSSTPVSTKRITPMSVTDASYMPSSPSSPRTTSAPKVSTPAVSSSGLPDALISSGQPVNNRSFLSAFQNFTSTYPQSELPAAASQQKFGSSLQEPSTSKDVGQSVHSKLGPKTQHLTASLIQQKLPQESKPGNLSQQKAAVKSSYSEVVNKDIPNSSWSNVNSVVSPIVSVPRLASTSPKSIATFIDKEINAKLSQSIQKQVLLHQEKQQAKQHNSVDRIKTLQNVQNKKKQPNAPGQTNLVNSTNLNMSLMDNKSLYCNSVSSSNDIMQHQRNIPASQAVSSTSVPKSISNPLIKTSNTGSSMQPMHGIVQGTGTKPSEHIASHIQQCKGSKQPNIQKTFDQISSTKSLKAPTVSKSSPASSPLSQSLLLSSPLLPQSRGSTPSPQKSPENHSLSLYEQIQSQILKQEAMEGQALKNLAMALNFSSGSSNSAFRGTMPATVRKSVESDSVKTASPVLDSKPMNLTNDMARMHDNLMNLKPTAAVSISQPDILVHNNPVKNISMASQPRGSNTPEKHSASMSATETGALFSGTVQSKEEVTGRQSGKISEAVVHGKQTNREDPNFKKSQQISVLSMKSKELSASSLHPQAVVDSSKTFKQPMEVYRVVSPSMIKSSLSRSSCSPSPFVVSTDLKLPMKKTEHSLLNSTFSNSQFPQKSSTISSNTSSLQESLITSHLQEQHPKLSKETQKYS